MRPATATPAPTLPAALPAAEGSSSELSSADRAYLERLDRCRAAGQLTEAQALDIFLTLVDYGVYVDLPRGGDPPMTAVEIVPACRARGWSRSRLIVELRRCARARAIELPGDDSLRRMVRQWVNGARGLSPFYAELLGEVFATRPAPPAPAAFATVRSARRLVDALDLAAEIGMAVPADIHQAAARVLAWAGAREVTTS